MNMGKYVSVAIDGPAGAGKSTMAKRVAKELGYRTFFWSLAYVDWYEDDQPTKEEAFDKLLRRWYPQVPG